MTSAPSITKPANQDPLPDLTAKPTNLGAGQIPGGDDHMGISCQRRLKVWGVPDYMGLRGTSGGQARHNSRLRRFNASSISVGMAELNVFLSENGLSAIGDRKGLTWSGRSVEVLAPVCGMTSTKRSA